MRVDDRKRCRMLAGGEPQGEKERQASKIKELADTLVAVGFASLDDQAQALGLSRSTTWTILKGKHKNYGLSAAVINRVLSHPGLNTHVRATIIEYVREKAAGSYGHNESQLRRFVQLLTGPTAMHVQELACAHLQTRRNALTGHTAAGR